MNHLVSVITPSYNSKKFISQAIESVLAQSYQNWEMIIIDDASTDSSDDIIFSYTQKDSRIKSITSPTRTGPGVARNLGMKKARGRYIAFLDSDDYWASDKLARQIQFTQSNQLAFSYTSYKLIDENNQNLGVFITKSNIDYKSLLKTCNIGCSTVIYDAEKLGKLYMPDMIISQDYILWLSILKQIKHIQGMPEALSFYRLRQGTLSSNKLNTAKYQWIVYREVEKLGFLISCYYFIHYLYHGITKYICRYRIFSLKKII